MADMKVQIKIESTGDKASKDIKKVSKSLEETSEKAKLTGKSLDETEKSAQDVSDAIGGIGDSSNGVDDAKSSVDRLHSGLKNLERQVNDLGKSLTKVVSGPLAALAGISLKNLYDTGSIAESEGPARQLALAVQDLRRNFRELSLEIGEQVSPVFIAFLQHVNSAIRAFRSLDDSTKKILITVGLLLGALGPGLIMFANILKLFTALGPAALRVGQLLSSISSSMSGLAASLGRLIAPLLQLIPGLKAIAGLGGGMIASIAALVASIAGLVNVFYKLRSAGVDTADALRMSFNLFVTGFNNFVVGSILDGVSLILKALGSLSGAFSKSIGDSLKNTASIVDGWSRNLSSQFQSAKGNVDSALESVGSSAGEAFTFGLSTKLGQLKGNIVGFFTPQEMGGQLASELGKTLDATYRQLELMQQRHQLNMEMANFEHQKRMQEIDTSQDPSSYLEERLQKHAEFLRRKQELDLQDLLLTQEIERKKLESIEDLNERRIAEKELLDKQQLELSRLQQEQEVELLDSTNKEIEEKFKSRYDDASKYVSQFSSGMANMFVEVGEGSKSLGEAFSDFARSFIRNIAQMILQAQIYRAIMSSIPGLGMAEGGLVPPVRRPYASGGHVRGPGTGTSDSIPAWLSNGEYVIRAAAVKKLGVRFLDGLNNIASGRVLSRTRPNGFADGGLVTSASVAPQVVINNNGTPKQVTDQSFDPKTGVMTLVMDDVEKNGPFAKMIQNTYGLSRKGFA